MRKLYIFIFLLAFSSMNDLTGQTKVEDHLYIRDKLAVFVFNTPKTGEEPFRYFVERGSYPSFTANPEFAKINASIQVLMNPSKNEEDKLFQKVIRKILELRGKKTNLYLVNDKIPIKSTDNLNPILKTRFSDNGTIWPHAFIFKQEQSGCNCWGSVFIGTTESNKLSPTHIRELLAHELFHTQDLTNGRVNLIGGHQFQYGNGGHADIEVLPLPDVALKEAIGTSLGFLFNEAHFKFYNDSWFASYPNFIVEIKKPAGFKGQWMYEELVKLNVKPDKIVMNGLKIEYALFNIKKLPPRMIIKNEVVLSMILYQYLKYGGVDRLMLALYKRNIWGSVGFEHFSDLFLELSAQGLPTTVIDLARKETIPVTKDEAIDLIRLRTKKHAFHKLYLLPLAYADYYTNFNAKTAVQFSKMFDDKIPIDWINEYWGDTPVLHSPTSIRAKIIGQGIDKINSILALEHYKKLP